MTTRPLTRESLVSLFGIAFTEEQLAAITAPHAPAVVIAGAGSGKTALMSARVVWLVAAGAVDPDAVLGLTFTNKAAGELNARVRRALRLLADDGYALPDGEPTISTYHAYAGALLREYGVFIGYEPSALVLTDAQRVQLAESVVRRAPGPFPALKGRVKGLTEKVVALEAELNEHLVDLETLAAFDRATIAAIDEVEHREGKVTADPARARATAQARLELLPLVADLRREKQRRERVDFGDQMAAAAVLAEQVASVAAIERDRFATVLLDEYQDTSMAQQRLLVALFGRGHPVMAVGDPFQSIYGWRGASVRNILSFRHDFADPEPTPVHTLAQNNRSGERILDVANVVAEPLRRHFPDVVPLRPRSSHRGEGEVVAGLYLTSGDEVAAVCDDIAAQVASGRRPGDIAVLCRESKAFGAVIDGLTQRQVPVEVVGLAGLLDLPEVVEVVSLLEVLHDPGANPSLVRLLAGPRWRIGPEDLALLGARAAELASGSVPAAADPEAGSDLDTVLRDAVQGIDPVETVSLLEALEDPGARPFSDAARHRFRLLAAELRSLRPALHDAPDLVLSRVVAATGLDVELRTSGAGTTNLEALLEHARSFSASGGGSGLGPFLSYLAVARRYGTPFDVPAPLGGTGGVALLTVHKAKGLEWPVVYVPQVSEGVFPSGRTRSTPLTSPAVLPYELRGDAADFPRVATWLGNQAIGDFKRAVADRELAEDRRLAYVALTRAAERLVVTGHRWGPTQSEPRGVSPYLEAVADFCRTGGGQVVHWEPEPTDQVSPVLTVDRSADWPARGDRTAAAARREAADLVRAALSGELAEPAALEAGEQERLDVWDADIEVLLAEATRRSGPSTTLPASVSASQVVDLLRDPAAVEKWNRPLPRRPAAAAYRGTRFHQWVEARFGQVPLLDLDGLLPVDAGFAREDADAELRLLQDAFVAGPYADRPPLAVEAPFQMVLGEQLVVGRIDAVYAADPGDVSLPPGTRYEVVDWKTGRHEADPLQLALYRLAWAELHGVPLDAVAATFYYVATGEVVRPDDLPDRAALAVWWRRATPYAPTS